MTKKEAVIDLGSLKKGDKIEGELMDGTKFEGIFEVVWASKDPDKAVKMTLTNFSNSVDEHTMNIAKINFLVKVTP